MATQGPQAPAHETHDPTTAGHTLVEYEEFIEDQLRKTRSRVRGVDIAAAVMVLAAATVAFFLLAGLVDHWLITGGLGFWGRLLLFAAYLTAAGYWTLTEIVPLLVKRINPLYAAQTIERSQPRLKNTLLNFLLFRANPAGVHKKVMAAIEEQAATNLAGAEVDSAVDRSRLIRLGYVLVAVMIVCAAYMLLSPKDLLKTVGRVAMPWADISAPTRTTIDEITPGDAAAFRGQQVTVKARVRGLPDDGRVILYYTTADRQIVDRAVEMNLPPDEYQHAAVLPAGDAALQQTLTYTIKAGDAVTRPYTIEVVAAPTIVVRAVEYEYPQYTGLLKQRVEHQGDVKAIEGTRVTLEAVANQDIDSAHVDFDCNDRPDLRMQAREQTARGTFSLSLREDRRTPVHGSYQVVFKNAAGERNPQPVRHQIEVTADLAPEIQFVAPKRDEIDLPADAAVDLEVVASDPDFALSGVTLSAAGGQTNLLEEKLLEETWRGQFVKKFRFRPAKLGLKPGDVIDYWAVAMDNKQPEPNRAVTDKRRIRIVSPSGRKDDQDQLAQNDNRRDRRDEPGSDGEQSGQSDQPQNRDQAGDGESDKSDSGEGDPTQQDGRGGEDQPSGESKKQPQDGQSNDGQQGESQEGTGDGAEQGTGNAESGAGDDGQGQESVPNDGTNDGEAIERILKHRDEQNGDGQPSADERDQQGDESQDGRQGSSGEQGGNQAAEKQPAGDRQSDGQRGTKDQQQPDGQSPRDGQQQSGQSDGEQGQRGQGERTSAGEKNRQKPGDNTPPDGDRSGDSQAGEKSPGKNAAEKKPAGANNDRQSSDESGQGPTGEKPTDPSQSRDQRNVDHERGEGNDPQNAQGKGQGDQPKQKDPRRQTTRDNNTREDGTPQDPSTKGQGGQSKDDPTRHPDQKPKQDGKQRPDARGGDGEQEKGQSGAGQESNDDKGSPRPQQDSKPTQKSKQPGPEEKNPMRDGPEQSPSTTKRESDSEGQEDGDRSGGGKRGGGQKANKPGTGGAGQNTSADEGAGRSDEAGEGESSDRAGGDRQSDDKTGQSGSETGDGSRSKPSEGNQEKPGGDSAPKGDSQSPSSQPPSGENNSGSGAQGGESPNASDPKSRGPREQEWKPGTEKADKANLDYARKATNLALEHLKDELRKEQPDQELLDRLGWSREDLQKFVKRWESMRASAQAPGDKGAAGKRELDETLRSLGLRPRATTLKSRTSDDRAQGYQESHRTTPPAEYSESFKAYTQGTARGGK